MRPIPYHVGILKVIKSRKKKKREGNNEKRRIRIEKSKNELKSFLKVLFFQICLIKCVTISCGCRYLKFKKVERRKRRKANNKKGGKG